MSAGGPPKLLNITEDEKTEFMPIYAQYITGKFGPREILTALKGDKEKYKRFQGYAALMTSVLKVRQSEKKVEALTERRDMLVQQQTEREATIAASRAQASGAALPHAPSVRVSPTKS